MILNPGSASVFKLHMSKPSLSGIERISSDADYESVFWWALWVIVMLPDWHK